MDGGGKPVGVFAIIDASSANASPGVVPESGVNLQPVIIILPSELQASLYSAEQLTQTLRINSGGAVS